MTTGPLRLIPAAPAYRPLAVRVGEIVFKKAEHAAELSQVHALNYQTFVRELGQYSDSGAGRLVDKFDQKNLYLVAKRGAQVVAMLAVHDRPPFSIESRLADREWIARNCPWPLEVRLLAIPPAERNRVILYGLLWSLFRVALSAGYSHLLASGVRQQMRMYTKLGFRVIGPEQQSGGAWFTPLCLDLRHGATGLEQLARRFERHAGLGPFPGARETISLLPGPAEIPRRVRRALGRPPISHRDARFQDRFEACRATLMSLTSTPGVGMLVGSGTLANECVAATLASEFGGRRGLILENGAFGERLIKQAARWRLQFDVMSWPWGAAWDVDAIETRLHEQRSGSWIWGVHCETSTGVLNDIQRLLAVARPSGCAVALDCISSLGSVPLDLSGVFLASGVSGKCLASVAGVAMLFGSGAARSAHSGGAPVYLDARAALAAEGPQFTFPAQLLDALVESLCAYESADGRAARYAHYARLGACVRDGVTRLGGTPLATGPSASPCVTTFAPLLGYSPRHFALLCRSCGFEINALSPHLVDRGLVQIATMGDVRPSDCNRLFSQLSHWAAMAG